MPNALLALILTGCAADESAAGATCATTAPDDCAAAGCVAVRGTTLADDGAGGWCTPPAAEVTVACLAEGITCPPQVVYAAPPDAPDTCVELPAGCTPEGWTACALDYAPPCP